MNKTISYVYVILSAVCWGFIGFSNRLLTEAGMTLGNRVFVRNFGTLLVLTVVFGLFHVADWLYGGLDEPFRLLTGLGFLLLAPEAFRNPISLRMPLPQAFAPRPRTSGAHDWLAALGVLLLLAALAMRWL